MQENAFCQNKIRTQGSKKVGCPALIRITRIAKFPQYKVSISLINIHIYLISQKLSHLK